MSIRDYISCVCVFIFMKLFEIRLFLGTKDENKIFTSFSNFCTPQYISVYVSLVQQLSCPLLHYENMLLCTPTTIFMYPRILTQTIVSCSWQLDWLFSVRLIMLRDRSVFVFGALSLSLADTFTVDFSSVTLVLQQKDVLSSRQTVRLDRRGLFNELVCAWNRTHIHFVALRITAQILPCNGQMKRAL